MRNSPALAAGRISAPVLLFTADRDYVPPGQAEELFSALYRQQKDVVLVTYRGEGHVLSSPANIRNFYDTVWTWLDEVLQRPQSAPIAPTAGARKMD
ncbi:Prolyl oligopeptidase family protein [compost metagenome]